MRELPRCEAPVLTRDDGADPRGREEDLEVLGAVFGEDRDPIAPHDTSCREERREPPRLGPALGDEARAALGRLRAVTDREHGGIGRPQVLPDEHAAPHREPGSDGQARLGHGTRREHEQAARHPLATGDALHGVTTPVPNFTRLVVQGSTTAPLSEWIKLHVDTAASPPFSWTRITH